MPLLQLRVVGVGGERCHTGICPDGRCGSSRSRVRRRLSVSFSVGAIQCIPFCWVKQRVAGKEARGQAESTGARKYSVFSGQWLEAEGGMEAERSSVESRGRAGDATHSGLGI